MDTKNHIAHDIIRTAVAGFSQALGEKVQVNAPGPGETQRPMPEAAVKCLGRMITDRDALVAFLALDEAAFMCGSLVGITGAQAVA